MKIDPYRKFAKKKEPDDIDLIIMLKLGGYPPATLAECANAADRSTTTIKYRIQWLLDYGYAKKVEGATPRTARSTILTAEGFKFIEDVKNGYRLVAGPQRDPGPVTHWI